jgi:TIR domain
MNNREPQTNFIDKKYLVAVSFSGEKRDYVKQVTDELSKAIDKAKIFYDDYHQGILPGIGTDEFLQKTYRDDSAFLVVFISPTYKDKVWCGIEGRAIRERINTEKGRGIIPVRFSNATTEWFSTSLDTYIDGDKKTPAETAAIIIDRIRIEGSIPFARPHVPNTPQSDGKRWMLLVSTAFIVVVLFILIKSSKITDSPILHPDTLKSHRDSPMLRPPQTEKSTTNGTENIGSIITPPRQQKDKFKNTITGVVYFNSNPVAGAKVAILGKGQANTDSNGFFSLEIPMPLEELTTLTVTISHPDYKTEPNSAVAYNKTGLKLYFLQKKITNEKDSID